MNSLKRVTPVDDNDFRLQDFTILGEKIPDGYIVMDITDDMSPRNLTIKVLDMILKSGYKGIHEALRGRSNVIRHFERKYVYSKGERYLATFDLERSERIRSLIGYLFYNKDFVPPKGDKWAQIYACACSSCKNLTSGGPGKYCILMPKDFLGGACTNCAYSNESSQCDVREKKKTAHEAASFASGFAEYLKGAEYLEVKALYDLIAKELGDRKQAAEERHESQE
ncbi:hypothetical protein VMCG_03418 [Cytospora schulzeri]|uniref:Uncharacterized protein n=1 Tax=Cytospora schulzeri TaxID=448051 RepID=A0A423WWW4_9PEZI|nr:hypothetical protein VMCG_03418 [Valsa malicola]